MNASSEVVHLLITLSSVLLPAATQTAQRLKDAVRTSAVDVCTGTGLLRDPRHVAGVDVVVF